MDRVEMIETWIGAAHKVLQKQRELKDTLNQIVKDYQDDPTTGCELYYQTIAEAIVDEMTDEQIESIPDTWNYKS